jgi:hypothetical protein
VCADNDTFIEATSTEQLARSARTKPGNESHCAEIRTMEFRWLRQKSGIEDHPSGIDASLLAAKFAQTIA